MIAPREAARRRNRLNMILAGLAVPVALAAAIVRHDRLLLIPAAMAVLGFAVSLAAELSIRRRGSR